MLLLRAREAALSYFRPLLQEHGLTEQQWRVLRVLNEEDEISAASLAQRAALLAPSLSRILKTLAERELVQSRKSSADGREVRVSLAAGGRDLVALIAPESESQYELIGERLSPARLAELYDLLHDFIEIENKDE